MVDTESRAQQKSVTREHRNDIARYIVAGDMEAVTNWMNEAITEKEADYALKVALVYNKPDIADILLRNINYKDKHDIFPLAMSDKMVAVLTLHGFRPNIGDCTSGNMYVINKHEYRYLNPNEVLRIYVCQSSLRYAKAGNLRELKEYAASSMFRRNYCCILTGERLIDAAFKSEKLDVIKFLLELKNEYGQNALIEAAENNNGQIVKAILEYKALDTNAADSAGNTALHYVVGAAKPDINLISLLIRSGADINQENRRHITPLGMANERRITKLIYNRVISDELFDAARNGDIDKITSLVKEDKANPDYRWDEGCTPLMVASHFNQGKAIVYLTVAEKVKLNTADYRGVTALMMAAANGSAIAVLALCMNKDLNIDQQDNRGMTALHHALLNKHTEVAKLLVEKGASIDIKNREGNAPAFIAFLEGISLERGTPSKLCSKNANYYSRNSTNPNIS